jgi:hypothetical protein
MMRLKPSGERRQTIGLILFAGFIFAYLLIRYGRAVSWTLR